MRTALSRRSVLGLVAAWVAALAIVAWLVLDGRAVALAREERATAAFCAVVEQEAVRTFQSLRLTLAAVADARALTPQVPADDRAFRQMMERRRKDVPFVRAIFIIGPDGWIIHDTDADTPRVSLADRPYFRAHAQDPALESAAWPPVDSRSGTGWFIPVTRALDPASGFAGVVVAAIQADHFAADFARIGLADGYSVALFGDDGTLVASHPPRPADVGRRFALPPAPDARAAGRGAPFWSPGGDGVTPGARVISRRRVGDVPFVVQVSRARRDVLAEWRRTATGAAVAMAALTASLAFMSGRLRRERVARERERRRRVQAEKLEALGQLTAGIAHDFGNLLNVVAMSADLIRYRRDDPPVFAQALAGLDRAAGGGRQLIDRLLSFARRRPLTIAPLRLDAWLADARPLLEQAAGARVAIALEAPRPVPPVMCDAGQLDTAVVNLVVNARDALDGSGRVLVRVSPCTPGGGPGPPPPPPARDGSADGAADGAAFVCLTVQDDGPGMSEDERRRALEPFYTTKGEAGTGLGLPQVYGFMQQLGGNMTVDAAPGGGTAVHLFFPTAPPDAATRR